VTGPVDVAELRRLLAAATLWPWVVNPNNACEVLSDDPCTPLAADCATPVDAALISSSTNALAVLLDRLEAAERERDEARSRIAELESLVRWTHTTYCTEAWTTRGMHAPECLCAEAGVLP